MSTVELKSSIHKYIDRIQNEQLLRTLNDFLRTKAEGETGDLWNTLTEEQKKEVILSYEESKDLNNLIEKQQIFKSSK